MATCSSFGSQHVSVWFWPMPVSLTTCFRAIRFCGITFSYTAISVLLNYSTYSLTLPDKVSSDSPYQCLRHMSSASRMGSRRVLSASHVSAARCSAVWYVLLLA